MGSAYADSDFELLAEPELDVTVRTKVLQGARAD